MRLNPNAPGGAVRPVTVDRGGGTQANSPALIGMSLRQDIPGGLLSSTARFRFSCQEHSETKYARPRTKTQRANGLSPVAVSQNLTRRRRSGLYNFQCSGFPALIPIDAVHGIHIIQEPGTLGTMGTTLKRHEFSSPAPWNRRGTLGTS